MSGSERATWAIIVADGDGVPEALPQAIAEAAAVDATPRLIAADGGARRALDLGRVPDLVVGDLDSIQPAIVERLVGMGVAVRRAPTDKDESDTELCLRAAVEEGQTTIRIVGALGGRRVEHSIANLLLLSHPLLDGLDAAIVAPPSVIRRVGTPDGGGEITLDGTPGDHVSLLAVDTAVEGVRTAGLRFPLRDEALRPGPARGLSNELLAAIGRVRVRRGRLLIIHTTRPTQPPEDRP